MTDNSDVRPMPFYWGLAIDRSVPPEVQIEALANELGCTPVEAGVSYWINLLLVDLMAVNNAAFMLNEAIGVGDNEYPVVVRLAQVALMLTGSKAQTSIEGAKELVMEAMLGAADVDEFLSDLFRDQEPG